MDEPNCSKSDQICALCMQNDSKYCCPRCGLLYCSLVCYKSENHLECSESFYRDCVNEELAGQQFDDESKNQMIKILKGMQQKVDDCNDLTDDIGEDSDPEYNSDVDSDDEECNALEERMKDVDLNDPDAVWIALNQDERNEFEALLNKGDIESIVPRWQPWWSYHKKTKAVEEVNVTNDDEQVALKKCPLIKEVPKLSSLTSINPSGTIRFNITNILASYAFVMRYFNGDLEPLEGVAYLLSICDNLNNNTNFNDVEMAIESVAQNCMKVDLIETDQNSLDVMKHDTTSIVRGPSKQNSTYYAKAALSHLYVLFFEAKQSHKQSRPNDDRRSNGFYKIYPDHGTQHLPSLDINKLKISLKKIDYYLSYIESYGMMM